MVTAERVRRAIQGRLIVHGSNAFAVTCSVGVAQVRPDESLEDLMRRADQALYRAKRAGRNRVFAAEPGPGDAGDESAVPRSDDGIDLHSAAG